MFFIKCLFSVVLMALMGSREENTTYFFDNEWYHRCWKGTVLAWGEKKVFCLEECDILKDALKQFELIRSYKIIFGNWHLSIDERSFFFFFSDPELMSFKWIFHSPPPLQCWQQTCSMSQQCHLWIIPISWQAENLRECLEPFKRSKERDHFLQNHCWWKKRKAQLW